MPEYNLKLTMLGFVKETPRLMLAPAVIGITALALYLLGMVPAYIQSTTGVREYSTIQQAEAHLGFEISVPAYFPNYLSWPPSEIRGQLKPFPMVQMRFLAYDQHTEVMSIYQIVADSSELPMPLPLIKTIQQEAPVDINGNIAQLVIGERADGQPVNLVYWTADNFHFIVVMTHPVRELLTIARSMH